VVYRDLVLVRMQESRYFDFYGTGKAKESRNDKKGCWGKRVQIRKVECSTHSLALVHRCWWFLISPSIELYRSSVAGTGILVVVVVVVGIQVQLSTFPSKHQDAWSTQCYPMVTKS